MRAALSILLLGCSLTAQAVPPDSGGLQGQIEQDRRRELMRPALPERIEALAAPSGDGDEVRIIVREFVIRNASRFSVEELQTLLRDSLDQEIGLAELKARIGRITEHYHKQGYPAAYAYLPPQEIGPDGKVEILVIEGYFGEVHLRNASRMRTSVVESYLPRLQSGDALELAPLERSSLLLNELSGIGAQIKLNPGKDSGFADLDIDVADQPWIGGALTMDNQGSRHTGDGVRHNLGIEVRNPSTWGDALWLTLLDAGPGMNYLQAGYQAPRGLTGLFRMEFEYSRVGYHLGGEFVAAGMQGDSENVGLRVSYPLVRRMALNVTAGAGGKQSRLQDRILSVRDNRARTLNTLDVGLSGDWQDTGYNRWEMTLTHGQLEFDNIQHRRLDSLSARTQGMFGKAGWSYSRIQPIPFLPDTIGSINVSGQMAMTNLDSSEKMSLGGMHGVSAYPSGEALGDDGVLLKLQLEHDLSRVLTGIALLGFGDYGQVDLNHKPWLAVMANNSVTLAGLGAGIRYQSGPFSLTLQRAWRMTARLPTAGADTPAGRQWLEMRLSL